MGFCLLISLFIFESSWYSVLSAVDYFVESSEEDKYEHIESLRTAGHGNLWNIMLIQRTKRLLYDFVAELIRNGNAILGTHLQSVVLAKIRI